jgi:hypothetical protein
MFTKTDDYACDKMGAVEQEVKGAAGSRFDTGKTAGHQLNRAQGGYRDASGRNPRNVWNLSARRVQLRSDISEDEKKMVLSRLVDAGLI